MNLGKYCFFVFFFFSSVYLRAQTLNFKHISYKEGLVQSPISTLIQDDRGFIWFGNFKGLTRYDGYEFKTFIFDEKDVKSLSSNRVNVIYQDTRKNLWIATANGFNLYQKNTENFKRIDILEIKGGRNYISSLVEDGEGNMWVGTFAGIRRLNKKTLRLEEVFSSPEDEALASKAIFSLFLDKDKNIWAGTKLGIRRFDPKTVKQLPLPASFADVKELKVLVTKQGNDGKFWFGTETGGVFSFSEGENTVTTYTSDLNNPATLTSNWVKDILIYDKAHIWFATRNGISILDTETGKFSNHRHDPANLNSLSDNSIWSFFKDRAGCVWVGTFAGGINFYYRGNANFKNIGESIGGNLGLNHPLVNAVSEDKDGSWWIGTFGGGLGHISADRKNSEHFYVRSSTQSRTRNGIKSLADDGRGNLWIGSLDGLGLFNKENKTFSYFNIPVKDGKLSENLICAILPEGEGAWIGTNGGGLRYVLKNGTSTLAIRKEDSIESGLPLSDNFVSAIIRDQKGNLWVGTQNGLDYFDIKQRLFTKAYKKIRNTKYQINNSNITTLFIDSKKRLWIGTEGGGLNYYDEKTERFYAIGKSLGLGDDVVHAIVEDDQHHLWLSTDLGIYKVMFKSFQVPFLEKNLNIIAYSASDGLISNQFSNNAAIKLRTGELLFGGMNGLSAFYPEKIIKNGLAPKVAITKVLVNNREVGIGQKDSPLPRSIVEASTIVVPYDYANLSFTFSALNFISQENNQYAYMLEGLSNDEEWKEIGTQRTVNFANLSPGSYIFKVKASNNDQVWGDFYRSLKITVLPPWWATWWAYLLYFVGIGAVLITILRFLRNRAILKRDLYLEHLHNLRQDELYKMKLNFFTNISHEIRTPLTLILGPLEKLITGAESPAVSKSLRLIKSNADRLMKLVTELLDFRKAEEGHLKIQCEVSDIVAFCRDIFGFFENAAMSRNMEYNFVSPEDTIPAYFDKNQLEKVIFNLLSNAFKFTDDGGRITLSVNNPDEDQEWVTIVVSDNGKGIPEGLKDKLFESFFQVDDRGRQNIGSGIGLALSKSIVELHEGTLKVESESSSGNQTAFTILLPRRHGNLAVTELISRQPLVEDDTVANDMQVQVNTAGVCVDGFRETTYKIMLAEDNDELREFISDSLRDSYQVIEFANGEKAWASLAQELPDLIISDIMMPGIDGLEFCKRVKLNEATNHIPFILLTAKASVENQMDGLSIGADVYISKPFNFMILAQNIKNLIRAQEILREKFTQRIVLEPTNMVITTPEEKFIHKLMEIIDKRLDDSLFDVNALVSEIGMSRTVLYKKVQTLTNFPVADLIKQMRLKRAATLLKTTSFNISEITFMVGLNDRKHFSKEFKKQYDLTPSEYVKVHKESNA
ncbi:MAG: hybrid sensor histidine kinase/response regulator [Pedobacter sp.]|nr:MAG: hybrid sensor histidine kinase/response regulator [Pedobacter sp.]